MALADTNGISKRKVQYKGTHRNCLKLKPGRGDDSAVKALGAKMSFLLSGCNCPYYFEKKNIIDL